MATKTDGRRKIEQIQFGRPGEKEEKLIDSERAEIWKWRKIR